MVAVNLDYILISGKITFDFLLLVWTVFSFDLCLTFGTTNFSSLCIRVQVMWVCNLCRKQQEILTKSGAWFYNSGSNTSQQPDQKVLRGLRNEEAPQEKKAKVHEQAQFQGPPGDLSVPAVEKSRSHGLTRQDSIKNGSGVKHQFTSDIASDR